MQTAKASASGRKAGSKWLRDLDFYAGIPLLQLLRFGKRTRHRPETIRRIALIKADGMGDLVLLTAIFRDLKYAIPDCQISLWCGRSVSVLARELALVDEVCQMDFTNPWQSWRKLRRWEADVVINAGQWSRSEGLVAGMGGGKYSIGFDTAGQRHHALYDATVVHRDDQHELENFRALLTPLGFEGGASPEITLREIPTVRLPVRRPFFVFHLWPSGVSHVELKQWPMKAWAEFAGFCLKNGRQIVLSGGPQDRAVNEQWLADHGMEGQVLNAAGVPILETIGLLQEADAVISVNTGIMHLAAALGVPTVGLHGPTDPLRWGPVGPRAAVCAVPAPAGSYLHLGFEYPADARARKGIETIQVDDVIGKLGELGVHLSS